MRAPLMVIGKFITADFGRFESQVPGPRQVPWAPLYGLPSPRANPSPMRCRVASSPIRRTFESTGSCSVPSSCRRQPTPRPWRPRRSRTRRGLKSRKGPARAPSEPGDGDPLAPAPRASLPARISQQILFRTDASIEFHAFLRRSEFLFDISYAATPILQDICTSWRTRDPGIACSSRPDGGPVDLTHERVAYRCKYPGIDAVGDDVIEFAKGLRRIPDVHD
jgi:hypothetical protein